MAIEGREQLKRKFKAANIGYESYRALIDSTLNKKDDGIENNEEDGLKLSLRGNSYKLLSFYDDKTINQAEWYMRLNPDNLKGLDISNKFIEGKSLFLSAVNEIIDEKRERRIRVGIGTSKPQYTLDVEGTVAMRTRVGSFKTGKIPADRKWHTILDETNGLDDCQAYEIIAHINDNDSRRFALTHAVILISEGPSGAQIRASSRYLWGKFLNKIRFRRKKVSGRYVIQIRSRDHFGFIRSTGKNKNIYYRVTKLWDKEFENDNYLEIKNVKPPTVAGKRDASGVKRIRIKK